MVIQTGTSSADYKVPNGKLLRIVLTVDDGHIAVVHINGDYFMHPESAVEDIEAYLVGLPLAHDILLDKLESYITTNGIEIIGADAGSIVHTILLAAGS